jgi:hypothetical protein
MKHFTLLFATASLLLVHCGATVSPRGDAAEGSDATSAPDVPAHDAHVVDTSLEIDTGSDVSPGGDATPLPGHCATFDPDTLIVPTVLMPMQSFGITARVHHMAFACGATPMLSGDGLRYSLAACGGCEACDCVDPGYEASALTGPLMPGTYTAQVGTASRSFTVAAENACNPVTSWPEGTLHVDVVGPESGLRVASMPRLWWAHLTGTESRCCGEPLVAGALQVVRPAGADLGSRSTSARPISAAVSGART